MPIYRLFEQTTFEPDDIAIIVAAYECAKTELHITDPAGADATALAKVVMRIAAEGDLSAQELCARAVASAGELGWKHSSTG
jgi:hypothetical protein